MKSLPAPLVPSGPGLVLRAPRFLEPGCRHVCCGPRPKGGDAGVVGVESRAASAQSGDLLG